MSESIKFNRVSGLPAIGTTGYIYFDTITKCVYVYNGSQYEPYSGSIVTEINEDSTNSDVPSAKCIYDVLVDNEETTSAALNVLYNTKVEEPDLEGASGQVLTTDGDGGRVWTTPISGIKMNNTVMGTSGIVDLGNVVTSLDGYSTTSSVNSAISDAINASDHFKYRGLVSSMPEGNGSGTYSEGDVIWFLGTPTASYPQGLYFLDSVEGTYSWISFINGALTEHQSLSNYYNKSEVNDLLGGITQLQIEVANSLPTASSGTLQKIYLVPSATSAENNIKDEYVTISSGSGDNITYSWEMIGSTAIDLDDYVTSVDLETLLSGKIDQVSTMPTASDSYRGKCVVYTGTTTASYTKGYVYLCEATTSGDTTTYSWSRIDVQPHQTLSYLHEGNGTWNNLYNRRGSLVSGWNAGEVMSYFGLRVAQNGTTTLPSSSSTLEANKHYSIGSQSETFNLALPTITNGSIAGFSGYSRRYHMRIIVDFDASAAFTPTISGGTYYGDTPYETVAGGHYRYTFEFRGDTTNKDWWLYITPTRDEKIDNKVTSLSSSSTDTQYPSAKCVYDMIGDIESTLDAIIGSDPVVENLIEQTL